jgi:hypothetical protein
MRMAEPQAGERRALLSQLLYSYFVTICKRIRKAAARRSDLVPGRPFPWQTVSKALRV